jgi:hypothetical protein
MTAYTSKKTTLVHDSLPHPVCPTIVLSRKESQAHVVDDVMMRRKTLFIMIFRAFMVFTLLPIWRLETF